MAEILPCLDIAAARRAFVAAPLPANLRRALAWAEAGFRVLPWRRFEDGRKLPCIRGWPSAATTDADQIGTWFRRWPEAQVGIALGDEFHLVDCDVAGQPAAGQAGQPAAQDNGIAEFEELCRQQGCLPATWSQETPSGGRHWLYKGAGVNSVKQLAAHVDTRGVGGFVAVYTDDPPSLAKVADGLSFVFEFMAKKAKRGRKAADQHDDDQHGYDRPVAVEEALRRIARFLEKHGRPAEGEGSDTLTFALACQLVDLPLADETIVDLLWRNWAPHFGIDWIAEKVANAIRYRQNERACERIYTGAEIFAGIETAADTGGEPQGRRGLSLASGGSVMPEKVEWLWPGWLALGKLHLLGGSKGAGKSTIAFGLSAAVTAGGKWPDGTSAPLGDVLIWSGEDGLCDTILPRLMAAGGDRWRVHHVNPISSGPGAETPPFDPATDMPRLAEAVRTLPNLRLVILDPVVSAVRGDSHKNAETRRGLQPVVDFAERTNVAVLGITHFTKWTEGKNPLERITGSLAFTALARVVMAAAADQENSRGRLVRVASNIGPSGGGFEYLLRRDPLAGFEDIEAQRAVWGTALRGSAKTLLDELQPQTASPRLEACDWLHGMLADGEVSAKDLREAADAHGHSWITVRRAKEKLGNILVRKTGFVGRAGWFWSLAPSGGAAEDEY